MWNHPCKEFQVYHVPVARQKMRCVLDTVVHPEGLISKGLKQRSSNHSFDYMWKWLLVILNILFLYFDNYIFNNNNNNNNKDFSTVRIKIIQYQHVSSGKLVSLKYLKTPDDSYKNAYNPAARKGRSNKITQKYVYICLVPFWSVAQIRNV